jgi:hypothetical protein
MFELIGSESTRRARHLLNLLEYYESILERNGLVSRCGDVKSLKLGLILDLLKTTDLSDDLQEKLNSAIIGAWEMRCCDSSINTEYDIDAMLKSIADIRKGAMEIMQQCDPNMIQLDSAVIFSLPLMARDLKSDEVPAIRDLLSLAIEDFLNRKDERCIATQ